MVAGIGSRFAGGIKQLEPVDSRGHIITELDLESLVSMNMWGLRPEFMGRLEQGFKEFFEKGVGLKDEFLIPTFIGELLEKKEITVKVLKTTDTWYGMTYKEDGPAVREAIEGLVEAGMYVMEF